MKSKKATAIKKPVDSIARLLDKPEGQYTHVIVCIECKAERKVKPQDVHQVKRCIECQKKKSLGNLKQLMARKADPVLQREEKLGKIVSRAERWAKDNDDMVLGGFKRLREYQAKVALEPRMRRMWP